MELMGIIMARRPTSSRHCLCGVMGSLALWGWGPGAEVIGRAAQSASLAHCCSLGSLPYPSGVTGPFTDSPCTRLRDTAPPNKPLSQGGLICLPLLSANTLQTLPALLEGFGRPVFPSGPPREFLFPFCASCPTFSLFVEQKSRLYLQLTPTCFSRTACNDLSLRCYKVLELFPEPLNSILMVCGIRYVKHSNDVMCNSQPKQERRALPANPSPPQHPFLSVRGHICFPVLLQRLSLLGALSHGLLEPWN